MQSVHALCCVHRLATALSMTKNVFWQNMHTPFRRLFGDQSMCLAVNCIVRFIVRLLTLTRMRGGMAASCLCGVM